MKDGGSRVVNVGRCHILYSWRITVGCRVRDSLGTFGTRIRPATIILPRDRYNEETDCVTQSSVSPVISDLLPSWWRVRVYFFITVSVEDVPIFPAES